MASDLTIRQGASVDKLCTLTDAAGDAFDLSGYTGGITSEIRDSDGDLIATFTVAESSLATGQFRLQQTASATALLRPGNYFFDVLFTPVSASDPTYRTEASTVRVTRRITIPA